MRIDAFDNFPVQFQDEAQNAVGRRMLRSEIDVEITDVVFSHWARSALLANSQ
jgi:hypothetical protein